MKLYVSEKSKIYKENVTSLSDAITFSKSNIKSLIEISNKEDENRIIIIDKNDDISVLYKKNKNWKAIEALSVQRYILSKLKIYPEINDSRMKGIFSRTKKKASKLFEYIEGKLSFVNSESYNIFIDELKDELNDENFVTNLNCFLKENGTIVSEKLNMPPLNNRNVKNVFDKFMSETNIKGYKYSLLESSESELSYSNSNVFHRVKIKDGKVYIISESKNDERKEAHYKLKESRKYIRDLLFRDRPINKKKMTKQVIYGSVGLIVFISILAFTLLRIFTISSVSDAFITLGDKNVWAEPWPYLLLINFIINFFWSWVITIIITLTLTKNKKIDLPMMFNALQAGAIRVSVKTITGNAYLATFAWGWFMANSREVRPAKIVGAVAVVGLLRSILFFSIAIPFIISGTVFASNNIDNFGVYPSISSKNAFIIFMVLSWSGFAWSIIHDGLIAFVLIMPFTRNMYIGVKNSFSYRKMNFDRAMINTEISVNQFTKTFKSVWTQKQRLTRISLMIIGGIVFEAFELTYVLNMVETSSLPPIYDSVTYWNIFSISGVRLMSTYAHFTPVLNILPGNGIGVVEPLLNNSIFAIIMSAHNWDINSSIDVTAAQDMALQAGFITRFFNSYLPIILRMGIALFAVLNVWHKLNKKI